jgi:nitrogen fixation/metabolism regulation signal transduction histidine kinase
VAHDVPDPLSPVLLALERISKERSLGDAQSQMVHRAIRSVGRIGTLVNDLRAFARARGKADPLARANVLARALIAIP